jgi:DNA ligase-1
MKPLLAHIYEPHRVTYPCYVQPKLNGIRALYQNGHFQSRDGIPFPVDLLRHLSVPLQQVFGAETILDGELYVHGWPLQRINAAVTPVRQHPTEDTLKVEYHVFDAVDFERPFIKRHWQTRYVLDENPIEQVKFIVPYTIPNESTANEQYAHYVSLGYEGMMYRLGDCPYTVPKQESYPEGMLRNSKLCSRFLSDKNNRAWHLLKRKDWQDHEYTCVGVEEGEGKYEGTLGALICDCPTPNAMHRLGVPPNPGLFSNFHVGSGLTDSQRDFYWRNPPIGKLIKVKYLCLSSDGIPLNPTIHPDHIIS